jgi:hypothetical protein
MERLLYPYEPTTHSYRIAVSITGRGCQTLEIEAEHAQEAVALALKDLQPRSSDELIVQIISTDGACQS